MGALARGERKLPAPIRLVGPTSDSQFRLLAPQVTDSYAAGCGENSDCRSDKPETNDQRNAQRERQRCQNVIHLVDILAVHDTGQSTTLASFNSPRWCGALTQRETLRPASAKQQTNGPRDSKRER